MNTPHHNCVDISHTEPGTPRLMVYSHDAFGLGNLRRMLAICDYLLRTWPHLSILLVSGSPMLQSFRLPKGLDYIKLPCLNRGTSGELSAKYLGTSTEETVRLRSQLIHSAALHFKPDLFLVDKKPTGLKGELTPTLDYLQQHRPNSKRVLLLRDILDAPEKTRYEWNKLGYIQATQTYYDQVLVAGMAEVFDLVQAYRLPLPIARKLRYCGYIRKQPDGRSGNTPRQQLGLRPQDRLVLVTPGGGEDGYALIEAYLQGLKRWQQSLPTIQPPTIQPAAQPASQPPAQPASQPPAQQADQQYSNSPLPTETSTQTSNRKPQFHSLILCGPEMPKEQQQHLEAMAVGCAQVTLRSFTNDLLSYIKAASTVVSMGGYNTLTEILTVGKPAVVVPRNTPSQEQLIRAQRFAQRGLITLIHPKELYGRSLIQAVIQQLNSPPPPPLGLNFQGLPNIAQHLATLMFPPASEPIDSVCLLA